MFQLPNKNRYRGSRRLRGLMFKAAFFLPVVLLLASCAFVDLRPIGISTVPGGPGALLQEEESPVIIRFDTEMEKQTVEKALQVYSPAGIVNGQQHWEGRALFFVPSVPWSAGLRYALRLSGTISALDGRELLLSKDIPFYAVSRSSLPYLRSFAPPDGASVGINSTVLELNFSLPMDTRLTEATLDFGVSGEKIFEWLDDCRSLRVYSDKPLNPWTVYRWSVSEKARSREGAPLAKEVSGRFVTDLDREFISVVRVLPLMPPGSNTGTGLWGGWVPAALSLEQGLGSGHGIGVEFSKPPESDSLRRSFGFVPPLPGRVEMLSPVSAVFIPSADPQPETVYSLRISGSLRDTEGLKMGDDYVISFRTDIPFLRVLSLSPGKDEPGTTFASGDRFPVPVNTGGIVQIIIHFSLPFDSEMPSIREECAFRISVRPFFPLTLAPVSLRTARWLSSDRLLMEWEGLDGGGPGEPHYYRLLIPGGSGGVNNGKGSYLNEDFFLFLEAQG